MPPSVKRRSYDATARRTQSARTRRRILDTARALIVARGYRATTIGAIAAAAHVNADTVYELVGRKPALLRELIEEAISGTDHPIAAEQRDYVLRIRAEPDPARKLAIYAGAVRSIQERMAPLFLALRDAASTDPEATAVWHEIGERRAANMRLLVRDVGAVGGLRPGLGIDAAADAVWALNSSEVFVLLTRDRGWSSRRYERWLADAWCRLLLAGGAGADAGIAGAGKVGFEPPVC